MKQKEALDKIDVLKEELRKLEKIVKNNGLEPTEVKTLDDVCEYLNIKKEELLIFINPKTTFEKYINACAILPKIATIYNDGTKLNWSNQNEYKYFPYKYHSGDGCSVRFSAWFTCRSYSAGLYFKSQALAELAYKNFKDIYEDYWS